MNPLLVVSMPRLNVAEIGYRVWTEGLDAHGHQRITVPATGGTIKNLVHQFGYGELYAVKWDTGHETLHYISEFTMSDDRHRIMLIGSSRTKEEFAQMIVAEAVSARKGRRLTTVLRNGDTIVGYQCPLLDWAKFPTEIEI
jgi:L-asparaginase/Glu-tRNA(Gln) amidotransferase subunit D